MRQQVIEKILNEKIVVIVRGVEKDKLIPLAEAMYNGGVRLLELTFDSSERISDEETTDSIKMLKKHFGDRMYIGAGTVTKIEQVEYTRNAGGEFIISPDTNAEIIKKTLELDMVSIPGAMTPTEIQTAHRSGADFVKLFPVVNVGSSYIKAVKAPLSNINILAVGGINDSNMQEYLDAGVCGFGIGSNIIDVKLLENGDYDGITRLAEKYVSVIKGGKVNG